MPAQTARLFGALASSEALEILVVLLERGPATVGHLASARGWPQPTASRHLKDLANLGLLARDRAGPYEVACPEELRALLDAAVSASLCGLRKREEEEAALQRRVRRTRFAEQRGEGRSPA